MSLFKKWEQHYMNGTLPNEWPIWEDCRTWAINNRYKIEYGYKGEFSPQGCLKAMPGYKEKPEIVVKKDDQNEPKPEVKPAKKGGANNASKKTGTRSRS